MSTVIQMQCENTMAEGNYLKKQKHVCIFVSIDYHSYKHGGEWALQS